MSGRNLFGLVGDYGETDSSSDSEVEEGGEDRGEELGGHQRESEQEPERRSRWAGVGQEYEASSFLLNFVQNNSDLPPNSISQSSPNNSESESNTSELNKRDLERESLGHEPNKSDLNNSQLDPTNSGSQASSSGSQATSSGSQATSSGFKATSSGSQASSSGSQATSRGSKATSSGSKATSSGSKATSSEANSNSVTGNNEVGSEYSWVMDEQALKEYHDKVFREELARLTQPQASESHERDWEIAEIQRDIQREKRSWKHVYSDEEDSEISSGVELTGLKKRRPPAAAPVRPVVGVGGQPGERWKRLQLMAETRVKNNPEKYASIKRNKFPLRD